MKLNTITHAVSAAVASALLISAIPAFAYTVDVYGIAGAAGTGLHSAVIGAGEADFESGMPLNYTGGAVVQGSSSSNWASPPGDTSKYLTVGPGAGQSSPVTISLNTLSKYFGYYGGSPDTYNSIQFWRDDSLLGTFSGAYLAGVAGFPATGNQSLGAYWNIWADNATEYFNQVRFISTSNAFETDNHAVAAVPLPAALPLLLSGLGLVGFARRKKMTAV